MREAPLGILALANFLAKSSVDVADEQAMKVKEQAILRLGALFAKQGQAEGRES